MEDLLTQYNQGLVGSQSKNQGVSKFVFFRFCNQRVGGEAPSPQEGASRRQNLIYIVSPAPACKAGLRGTCRSNPSVGSIIAFPTLIACGHFADR